MVCVIFLVLVLKLTGGSIATNLKSLRKKKLSCFLFSKVLKVQFLVRVAECPLGRGKRRNEDGKERSKEKVKIFFFIFFPGKPEGNQAVEEL